MNALTSQDSKQVETSGYGSQAVPVLDERDWATKAFYFDLLALAVLLLSALGLGLGLYVAGYWSGWGAAPANPSFGIPVRIGLGFVGFAASFTWIAARLIRAGYRALPGSE